jgi:hypothetical protein
MEDARAYLLKWVKKQLVSDIWGNRSYNMVVPPNIARPYVVFGIVNTQSVYERQRHTKSVLLQIKCVANTYQSAFDGASAITSVIAERGQQDRYGGAFEGAWVVRTITEAGGFDFVESVDGSQTAFYHAGYQYLAILEEA